MRHRRGTVNLLSKHPSHRHKLIAEANQESILKGFFIFKGFLNPSSPYSLAFPPTWVPSEKSLLQLKCQ